MPTPSTFVEPEHCPRHSVYLEIRAAQHLALDLYGRSPCGNVNAVDRGFGRCPA